ncbi:hypothetical protein AB0K14_28605 [Actinosynnema sp. NPDC050801]|uniref:hypothetical protein n=1 Tax=unclassified Actinosynnema TaxID=2637065 RepID=UPI00340B6543
MSVEARTGYRVRRNVVVPLPVIVATGPWQAVPRARIAAAGCRSPPTPGPVSPERGNPRVFSPARDADHARGPVVATAGQLVTASATTRAARFGGHGALTVARYRAPGFAGGFRTGTGGFSRLGVGGTLPCATTLPARVARRVSPHRG